MNNIFKNKNKEGGFVKLIIIIIVGIYLLRYYNISFTDVMDWLKTLSIPKIIDWFKQFVSIISNSFPSGSMPK